MITIYHNPHCSKSREALALVEQFAAAKNLRLDVVEYLKTPPNEAQLAMLLRQLGGNVGDMVRDNEDEYSDLHLAQADATGILRAIAANPRLLQRPIVVYEDCAVVGRPPERLHDFLRAQ